VEETSGFWWERGC
jgi:hypothetical protein